MSTKDTKTILDRWVETDLAAEAAAGRLGRAYGRDELLAAMEDAYVAAIPGSGDLPVKPGSPKPV